MISDVHSNLEALTSVLKDTDGLGGYDCVWCLSDIVGYGPDLGACIDHLRRQDLAWIAGNHDYGAVGKTDMAEFNSYAGLALAWTKENINEYQSRFLITLPKTTQYGDVTLVHGSFRIPINSYIGIYG